MSIKSERVKENTVPATLFVGVGGVGTEIVVKVAERCRGRETENTRFVVLDTNVNDLKTANKSRAVISVIQTSSTQTVWDYLRNDGNARKKWFPNNSILYPKAVSEGAGQVRAISRLALNTIIKNGEISKLYKAIDELFLKDGGDLKQALRVVIVSSAAGGTGSGIAMVLGMMIRKYLYKHYREKSAVIRGLLLLPGVMDTVIKTQTEQESLRRNGYATVKEINAFMMKASGFCEVRKDLERFNAINVEVPTVTDEVEALDSLPFDFCFLLDRIDSRQESMEALEQYKEFSAQSLYEQNIGPMQTSAFSMEDNIIKEFANEDNLGRNRFGGIGASTLRYPYEDIADYIAYSRAIEKINGVEAPDLEDEDDIVESIKEAAMGWLKYDKKYRAEYNKFKKKRASTSEKTPERGDVYIDELLIDNSRFGRDMKSYVSDEESIGDIENDVNTRIDECLDEVDDLIVEEFTKHPEIADIDMQMKRLTKEILYSDNERERGKAPDNLNVIRNYEGTVHAAAQSVARAQASVIFMNAPSIGMRDDIKRYHIESLFQTNDGAAHPNAMRLVLYMLKRNMEQRRDTAKDDRDNAIRRLEMYSPDAEMEDSFDFDGRNAKGIERCIDDVVAVERGTENHPKLWEKLNEHFPAYSKRVIELRGAILRYATYDIGAAYVQELCKEFQRFYDSFESKVITLARSKADIVDSLRFRKGDSVLNVCADERHMKALMEEASPGSEGMLLPGDLNVEIYDAVKKNCEIRRDAKYETNPYLIKSTADIFEDVMIDYFRESVRDDSADVIDMNIVQAIMKEQELDAAFAYAEKVGEVHDAPPPRIEDRERLEYIKGKLTRGNQLASPGISGPTYNEPRVISACAFSETLTDLRSYNVKSLLETLKLSPVNSDTVSKYEFRFFNALYNLTPDKLARFMNPSQFEENNFPYESSPGLYYNAYHNYIQNIGPDTTKGTTISLHVDKRWDAVSVLPEIDMKGQNEEMLRIHSALIYGVVQGIIKTRKSSRYDEKRVFELEDSNGELHSFVVSNNTECDEFHEVLDALYSDRASVKQIYQIAEERRKYDVEKNFNYEISVFARDAKSFKIGDGHEAPNSLFEIPLLYYNSLPRRLLDDNELSVMIDSVIHVTDTEVSRFEQHFDRVPFLCDQLVEQFKLLVSNFKNDAYDKQYDIRKNTSVEDNIVLSMTCKKIINRLKDAQLSDSEERIQILRDMLKG